MDTCGFFSWCALERKNQFWRSCSLFDQKRDVSPKHKWKISQGSKKYATIFLSFPPYRHHKFNFLLVACNKRVLGKTQLLKILPLVPYDDIKYKIEHKNSNQTRVHLSLCLFRRKAANTILISFGFQPNFPPLEKGNKIISWTSPNQNPLVESSAKGRCFNFKF